MSLIKWEPFGGLDDFFNDSFFNFPAMSQSGFDLAVDMYEEKGNIIAKMNLAGVDPKKVTISVEDGFLRISGSREAEKEEKKKNYYSKEISRGSFQRVLNLPAEIVEEKVKAEFEDGVLTIEMPKKKIEKKKTKKIKLKIKSLKNKLD